MSSRPDTLCVLEKGKALAAHGGFADTFNWVVSFCDNLKGEGEIDSGSSNLLVDREQDDYPVIRGGGGSEYICGDDSNIVFTPVTDDTDPNFGKIKIDVYYI